jgi:hypothetical protein
MNIGANLDGEPRLRLNMQEQDALVCFATHIIEGLTVDEARKKTQVEHPSWFAVNPDFYWWLSSPQDYMDHALETIKARHG